MRCALPHRACAHTGHVLASALLLLQSLAHQCGAGGFVGHGHALKLTVGKRCGRQGVGLVKQALKTNQIMGHGQLHQLAGRPVFAVQANHTSAHAPHRPAFALFKQTSA